MMEILLKSPTGVLTLITIVGSLAVLMVAAVWAVTRPVPPEGE